MQTEKRSLTAEFLGTNDLGFKEIRRIQQMGLRRSGHLGRKESKKVKCPRSQKKKVFKKWKVMIKSYVFLSLKNH